MDGVLYTPNSDRSEVLTLVVWTEFLDIERTKMASRDGDPDRRLRKTSIAWSYFTLVDEEKHIASCNTCEAHMSFRSSISNLMKHIKRKHADITDIEHRMSDEEKETDSEPEDGNKINLSGEDDEKQTSPVWEHFEITNAEKKVATCCLCQVPVSFRDSERTLLRHLRRKHNLRDESEVLLSDDEKKIDSPPSNYRSAIWPYFRITDSASKAARCLVCKKLLSYNTGTSNLRKHLQRKHPLIKLPGPGEERKTIILSSGDQLYEFEPTKGENEDHDNEEPQDEPIALDEVFLDEFNGSINKIETDNQYKPKKKKHKQKRIILDPPSDSDEELVLKRKYIKKELDSIDFFAKYLGSLLRELPRHVSNNLQKDFIRQIMNAQVECQTNNAYSITISNDSVPENVRFEVIAKDDTLNK